MTVGEPKRITAIVTRSISSNGEKRCIQKRARTSVSRVYHHLSSISHHHDLSSSHHLDNISYIDSIAIASSSSYLFGIGSHRLCLIICRHVVIYRRRLSCHGDQPSMTICHHWHPRHFLSDAELPCASPHWPRSLSQPTLTTQLLQVANHFFYLFVA